MSRAWLRPRLPDRVRLLLEVVLALALLLLDVRDLWFKTRWLGPSSDAVAFTSTHELELLPQRLAAATNASLPDQLMQRASGWNSFLSKCDSISPLASISGTNKPKELSHVLGRNCRLGPTTRPATVPELVFTSSLRVDAVAWSACKLLYHHRKPPICHSAIVKLFRERYAFDESPSLLVYESAQDTNLTLVSPGSQQRESAAPGSDAEMELLELLRVISRSAPLSDVVCVEGFALKGSGQYTSTIFGCGSPSYAHSAFVGQFATAMGQFLQNKAWLTSDVLHAMGMTLAVRTNARSLFHASSSDDGGIKVDHMLQVNVSSSGALYTLLVLVDVALLTVSMYSSLEIARWMLWPVWRSVMSNLSWTAKSSLHATKLGFTADDYRQVLRVSLLRSGSVAALTLFSRILTWSLVFPVAAIVFDAANSEVAMLHVALTIVRLWVVVVVCINTVWDVVVSFNEQKALRFALQTYAKVPEVAAAFAVAAFVVLNSTLSGQLRVKHLAEGQRLADSHAFRGFRMLANTFPELQDSLQNSPREVVSLIYAPLSWAVVLAIVLVATVIAARFWYFRLRRPDMVEIHHKALHMLASGGSTLVQPDMAESPSKSSKPEFLTSRAAGILMSSSPTKRAGSMPRMSSIAETASVPEGQSDLYERMPLEILVDIPMRARSLLRASLFMETNAGRHLTLRPSCYLEFGVLLLGGVMRTRCGFQNIVQPRLDASEHVPMADDSAHGDGKISMTGQVPLR